MTLKTDWGLNDTVMPEDFNDMCNFINTWLEFKKNGGDLGGGINLYKDWAGFLVSNSKKDNQWYNYANPNGHNMVLAKPGAEHYSFGEDEFGPVWGSQSKRLGSESNPWSDIYLRGSSKTINGYTRMPNGFIEQFGTITVSQGNTGGHWVNVNFPVSMTTTDYNIQMTEIHSGEYYSDFKIAAKNTWGFTIHAYTQAKLDWRAIGW